MVEISDEPKTKATTGSGETPLNADDDVTDSYEPEPSSEEPAETLDSNTPREDKVTLDEEDILFVEQKYCTVCNFE